SPAKLRRIRDYFAALCGLGAFPPVRCNAPEFSAVVGADGRVAPCFFIPAAPLAPRAPDLVASLASEPAEALRAAIRGGARHECGKCVCSMWRDPAAIAGADFLLGATANA
ncbi:MAG TPA: SPASM domain-containing protein, partial [Rhodanobacteraceae bacterium]|nr:SPASM domain-containing protein [Rhodanobacteraceae bacterium]